MNVSRFSPLRKRRPIAFSGDATPFAFVAAKRVARRVICASLIGCALSGCGLIGVSTSQNASANSATTSGVRTSGATSVQSPTASDSKPSPLAVWLAALTQKPAATPRLFRVAPTAVFIDVTRLAQRFPSWQLAARLENAPKTPHSETSRASLSLSNRPLLGFKSARAFGSLSQYRVLDRVLDASPNASSTFDFALKTRPVGEQTQSADEALWRDRARQRGAASLDGFLQAASVRQAASRRAQESEARATLSDDVLAARDVLLPPLEPFGLPAEVQLEIINLRLKLLPNSNTAAPEREKAQARLFLLQEVWRAKLLAQQQLLLDEWNRQREEEPLRVQREGETLIAAQNERTQRLDQARLAQLSDQQRRFLSTDFGNDRALAIGLPPYSMMQFSETPRSRTPRNGISNSDPGFFAPLAQRELFAQREIVNATSLRHFGVSLADQNDNSAVQLRTQSLRSQALRDARSWALNLARARGWKLARRPSADTRDETRSALQMLDASEKPRGPNSST